MIGPTFLLPMATTPGGATTASQPGLDFPTALMAATLLGGSSVIAPEGAEGTLEAALAALAGSDERVESTEERERADEAQGRADGSVDASSLAAALQPVAAPAPPKGEGGLLEGSEVEPALAMEELHGIEAVSELAAPVAEVPSAVAGSDQSIEISATREPAVTETGEAPAEVSVDFEALAQGNNDSRSGRGFDGGAHQQPSYDIGSPGGPSGARVESAGSPAAQQSSQAARRVMDIVNRLEHQPPPRQMVVELPELEGLRLQVALRGTGVHVSVLEGGTSAQLRPLSAELAQNLADRGFELADFSDAGGSNRQPREERPTDTFSLDGRTLDGRTGGRARKSDSRLRL